MWDYVFLECWSQFFSQISRELSASRAPRLLLKYGLLEQFVAGSAPAIFFGNWLQDCTKVQTILVLPHPLHYFLVVNLSLSLTFKSYGRRQTPTYGTEMFVSLESVAKDSTECEGELTPYTPGSPTPRAAAVTNPAVSNFR